MTKPRRPKPRPARLREKDLNEEAVAFLCFASGYLQMRDPDWKPDSALSALLLDGIRDELRPILEKHLPYLLEPREDANAETD